MTRFLLDPLPRPPHRWKAIGLGALMALGVATASAANALGADEKQTALGAAETSFAALLEAAEIRPSDAPLSALAASEFVDEQCGQVLARILYRIDTLPRDMVDEWAATSASGSGDARARWGDLVHIAGTARRCVRLELDPSMRLPESPTAYYRCLVETSEGEWQVVTPSVPRAWLQGDALEKLSEPVETIGVVIGAPDADGEAKPSVGDEPKNTASGKEASRTAIVGMAASPHIEWYPTRGVSAGVRWLAESGLDAAMWDQVRHRRRLVDARESREGEAFYACLAVVSASSTPNMIVRARKGIADSRDDWREQLDVAQRELGAARRDAGAAASPTASASSATASKERRAAILAEGLHAAEEGRTAFFPLHEWPEQYAGDLVLFEGTARRAVRVEGAPGWRFRAAQSLRRGRQGERMVDAPTAASQPNHYYEIDVYPADSRGVPIVCCAAALPSGFPEGDVIREPVRVAGVFFKSWRYRRRPEVGSDAPASSRINAPLILAAAPQWLPTARSTDGRWGMLGAAAFLLALAALWAFSVRTARRDRAARRELSTRMDQ